MESFRPSRKIGITMPLHSGAMPVTGLPCCPKMTLAMLVPCLAEGPVLHAVDAVPPGSICVSLAPSKQG